MPFGFDSRYAESVDLPWTKFESIPIYVGGRNQYFSSVADIDPINLVLYEDSFGTSMELINTWHSKIESDGFYGLPVKYRKNFTVDMLAVDTDTAIATFTVVNAWPTTVGNISLQSGSSDRIKIEATLAVDRVVLQRFGGSGGSGFGSDGLDFGAILEGGGGGLGLNNPNGNPSGLGTGSNNGNNGGWNLSTKNGINSGSNTGGGNQGKGYTLSTGGSNNRSQGDSLLTGGDKIFSFNR